MADTHVTTWQPDTCGCVLSYSWDVATSEDARVHTPFCVFEPLRADDLDVLDEAKGLCAAHLELDVDRRTHPGNANRLIRLDWHIQRATPLYTAVLAENQGKNRVREAVRQAINASYDDDFDFAYQFSGTGAARSLVVASRDLPANARAAVRAAAAKERIPVTVE